MIKSLLYTIRNGDSLSRSVADKLSFLRKYSFLTQKTQMKIIKNDQAEV